MIDQLIDKEDGSEIVGKAIATILLAETASQQALAVTAGKNPDLWKLRVFREATNPFEEFRDVSEWQAPIVNVWWDASNFPKSAGSTVNAQTTVGTFSVDVFGAAVSTNTDQGHTPGDQAAALEAQRAMRLVRNILMAATYSRLGLKGLVSTRWPQSLSTLRVPQDQRAIPNVSAVRLTLEVTYGEESPQVTGTPAEIGHVEVRRNAINGELLLAAQYDLTPA